MRKQVEEMVSKNSLQGMVTFLGYQDHDRVAGFMKKAYIFLTTSKGEGMSNLLLEAMATGMAIVATSASACGVLLNGVNGFMANSAEEIASIVSELINNTSLRHAIGRNARRTVIENYPPTSDVQ